MPVPKAKRRLSTNDEERMPTPPAPKKTRVRETPTTVILLDEDERPPPRYTTEPLESWRPTRGWKRPPGQRSKPKDPVFPSVDEILSDIHGQERDALGMKHVIGLTRHLQSRNYLVWYILYIPNMVVNACGQYSKILDSSSFSQFPFLINFLFVSLLFYPYPFRS